MQYDRQYTHRSVTMNQKENEMKRFSDVNIIIRHEWLCLINITSLVQTNKSRTEFCIKSESAGSITFQKINLSRICCVIRYIW